MGDWLSDPTRLLTLVAAGAAAWFAWPYLSEWLGSAMVRPTPAPQPEAHADTLLAAVACCARRLPASERASFYTQMAPHLAAADEAP